MDHHERAYYDFFVNMQAGILCCYETKLTVEMCEAIAERRYYLWGNLGWENLQQPPKLNYYSTPDEMFGYPDEDWLDDMENHEERDEWQR